MKKYLPKSKSRGVAILTVMVSLSLMMAIVTELSTRETVRYKLAINERDALQAEALAQSGANFAALVLTVQEPLQKYLTNFAKMGIQMPAYTVWDLMPIDSDLLKGITDGSFMPDLGFLAGENSNSGDTKSDDVNVAKINPEKEASFSGPYQAPKGGYGGFRGRFSTLIEDEEKKISLRRWSKHIFEKRKMVADMIFRVLAKPENDILFDGTTGDNKNIGPLELVGNLYDYVSDEETAVDVNAVAKEWGRRGSGSKSARYVDMDGILPKSAPFDSMAEMRLVPGVTDAIYQVLSKNVSVYSESEKINILSASDEVLATVFYMCTKDKETGPFQRPGFENEVISEWKRKKNEEGFQLSAEGIIKHLEDSRVEVDKDECNKIIGTESKTFTVKSTATVGNVTKTLIMRLRSAGGITTLYQFQYL